MPNSNSSPPRCFALIPCAGVGARAGQNGPKQYTQLLGQTVVMRTLLTLAAVPELSALLLVLSPTDAQFAQEHTSSQWPQHLDVAYCGGAQRADTVAAGLDRLRSHHGAQDHDWVLVHDAARCLIQVPDVQRLIRQCEHDAVGGLLALPVADTIKRGGALEGDVPRSLTTLDRSVLWAAQTPQMFRLHQLELALAQRSSLTTDEASAIEALGLQPQLVMGNPLNIKLTWPQDFVLAQALLNHQSPFLVADLDGNTHNDA